MANDFKPVVGHKFHFRTEPTEWWNGINAYRKGKSNMLEAEQ
jgi:hypothetical protein